MAKLTALNVTRIIKNGNAACTFTNPYDGVSAVTVDPDGMVRSVLPVGAGYHDFGLALEVGGRAMNLLHPYSTGGLCIHGLVKRERTVGSYLVGTCDCGIEPVSVNPPRAA